MLFETSFAPLAKETQKPMTNTRTRISDISLISPMSIREHRGVYRVICEATRSTFPDRPVRACWTDISVASSWMPVEYVG